MAMKRPGRPGRRSGTETPRRPGRATAGRSSGKPPSRTAPQKRVGPATAAKPTRAAAPAPAAPRQSVRLYVLSDSTGNLPQHMIAAFLTQFAPGTFHPILLTFLESEGKVANALEQVAQLPGPVMHALVSQRSKEIVAEFAARHDLPYCDLTGGFVEFLARAAGTRPLADVRRLHHIDESYHRRIGAIEFTLQHDDGLGLDTIGEADVVLVGVSRTSKTPTSIYLAQQGYKVANVSLAMGVTPPAEVDELPPNRAVGLVIDPGRLVEIRSARQVEWRMTTTDYNRRDAVEREVAWSRRLFRDRGWPVLDVTNHAVEETAGRVVSALGLGPPGAPRPGGR